MKVLMIGSDSNILNENSFARKRMERYAEHLDKLIVILLVKTQRSPAREKIKNQNYNSKLKIYISNGYFLRFFKAFLIGYKILKSEKIDLITAQDIEHGLIAFILSRIFKVPFQQQVHTDVGSAYFWRFSLKNKLRYFFAKFLLKRASCVRAVSKRIKDFLISDFKISEEKIAVIPIIPNIINSQAEPKQFPEFEKIILVAARLASEKNIALVIDAFAEALKNYPKAGLVIVGDGPEKSVLELKTKNHRLQTNVRFEGFQNNLAQYYKAADVFLLTSWYEGWGVSVVEAMYYGLPIVMTDVGLAGEVVKNGENGFVIEPGNKNGLIEALNKILSDAEFAIRMEENNKMAASQFLSENEYYEKIIGGWKTCALKSG